MMKKVLTALFFILSISAYTQKFEARIDAGLTSSQISGDGAYGFVQFGAMLGAEVSYRFNEQWISLFGLRFNQKGSRIYKTKNSVDTYRLRVNYIEVPLLANYSFDKFALGAGPVLGVKINQRERTQFGDIEDPRVFDPLELGVELNIGYQLKDRIGLRLLYQNSLISVRDHKTDQAFPPALFVLGTWHQNMLNQGQYFTSLSLVLTYKL